MKWRLVVIAFFFVDIIYFSDSAIADNARWEAAILTVQKKSISYYDFAHSREDFGAATGLNGLDAEKHRCAILGRMLGFRSEIKEAEYLHEPPLSNEVDAFTQLEYSFSLDSWVSQAKIALSLSPSERSTVWNLECPGKYGIPRSAVTSAGETRGEFEITESGTLMVYGDINAGFHERFVTILNENPAIKSVWLGSGGGSIRDAILSGLEIRRRGLATQLFSACFSTCPLLFAAGATRTIYPDQGEKSVSIGFHQISSSDGSISLDSPAYLEVAKYLTAMGSDGEKVVSWMKRAGPEEMYTPGPEALCSAGLATFVYHVCIQ